MQLAGDQAPIHRQFRAIYRDEFAFVWAVARRFGVPVAALDDAVQDVFLTAFRRIDRLGYQVSSRAWLYAVTRKVASHHRRSAMRLDRRIEALRAVAPELPAAPQERHHAADLLERLLAPLPRGLREVWEMTELLGMTGPEIAAELEVPLNTVYSRLRLARAQLSAGAKTIAACVAEATRHTAPPPEAAQRNWVVILPMLRPGSFTGIAAAWTTTRAALATTLIASAAVVTVVASPGPRPAPRPVIAEPAPSIVAPAPAIVIPQRLAAAPAALPTPRRPAPSPTDRLAAEVALLDAARDHLAAHAPAAALALLTEHARQFPDGALYDAREAARVEAACQLGDAAAAEVTARALVARHTDSLVARKYQHYVCAP
ncbi:MAG TPA: sigma-70 family RNA polymerase sigma factor [Nannocystis sp.]